MRTSRPRKPKRQKAAQTLNGGGEGSESEEEEPEQVKKESARLTPATDVRLSHLIKDRGITTIYCDNIIISLCFILLNLRGFELTDDVLHIIFSYLELKDRIRVERGVYKLMLAWLDLL